MRLNGWQRAWTLASALWIVGVIAITVFSGRSESERYHAWSNEMLQYLMEQVPDLKGQTINSVRAAYSDLSDKKLIDALHEKYIKQHPAYGYGFAQIDAKYSDQKIPNTTAWNAVLIALLPPPIAYILGFGIAWVRSGFKHQ